MRHSDVPIVIPLCNTICFMDMRHIRSFTNIKSNAMRNGICGDKIEIKIVMKERERDRTIMMIVKAIILSRSNLIQLVIILYMIQ